MHSGVNHELDLDRDGKQLSFLGIPFSVDRSPYFQIKVPVCVVRNGGRPLGPADGRQPRRRV